MSKPDMWRRRRDRAAMIPTLVALLLVIALAAAG